MSSGKNSVTAFAHVEGVAQLVTESKVDQGINHLEEFLHSVRLDSAKNFASTVAESYCHDVAPGAQTVGFIRKGGQHFLVVGERAFALDDLSAHGALPGCDIGELVYLAKFLMSVVRDAKREHLAGVA